MFGVDLRSKPPKAKPKEEPKETEEVKTEEMLTTENEQRYTDQKIGDFLRGKKYENLGIWVESNIYFKNFKRLNF